MMIETNSSVRGNLIPGGIFFLIHYNLHISGLLVLLNSVDHLFSVSIIQVSFFLDRTL